LEFFSPLKEDNVVFNLFLFPFSFRLTADLPEDSLLLPPLGKIGAACFPNSQGRRAEIATVILRVFSFFHCLFSRQQPMIFLAPRLWCVFSFSPICRLQASLVSDTYPNKKGLFFSVRDRRIVAVLHQFLFPL